MRLLCVIPARLGSTRLPDKPLRLVSGVPLIRRVAVNALAMDVPMTVAVAADDPRVLDAVADLPVVPVLTRAEHASGTARVAEVVARQEFAGYDLVVNLQGDEPFLRGEALCAAVEQVVGGADIGTVAQPLDAQARRNPNRVKVEVDGRGRAVRFYRTPAAPACGRPRATFQHIGIYATRPAPLTRWMSLPPAADERQLGLEQARPLAHGMTISVAILADPVPHGIDTEDDLRLAEARL